MEITTALVRELIQTQFPAWAGLEIRPVAQSGNDNRTFHLGEEMTVRLPSAPGYAPQVEKEGRWLPFLQSYLSLPIPCPLAMGQPAAGYPFSWSVNRYIAGETVTQDNVTNKETFAAALAAFLRELQAAPAAEGPAAGPHNCYRGASPAIYSGEVEAALAASETDWPVETLAAIWRRAVASQWNKEPVWLHGDIAPGNLLVQDGQLCAVIDFGVMGVGDPACDYAMAWTFFEGRSREAFLEGLAPDLVDRARGWALWKALISCRGSGAAAMNARRTIRAILEDCPPP